MSGPLIMTGRSDVVLYYPTNELSTGTTYDYSGNANNGTDTGTGILKVVDGTLARTFDGTGEKISTPSINLGEIYTISFWIKVNSITNSYDMFGDWSGLAPHVQHSYQGASTKYFGFDHYVGSSSSFRVQSNDNVITSTSNWYHVVFVRSAQNVGKIYVNGVDETSSITHGTLSSNMIADTYGIGALYGGGSNHLNGSMRGILIIHRVLTLSEIKSIYRETYIE